MNRPAKKNALDIAMYKGLMDALQRAEQSSEIRVIVLYGGQECFTSGNDLKDFATYAHDPASRPGPAFLKIISRVKKPIVAAVNGVAIGIGATMLLHCDLAFAGETSRFQLPFLNLGLCPEAASTYLLPRLAGHCIASELLLLGKPFSAQTAHEIGLVNQVLPDGEVLSHALSTARQLAAKPFQSVLMTKALLKRGQAEIIAETMREEGRCFSERLQSSDFKKAFDAFYRR